MQSDCRCNFVLFKPCAKIGYAKPNELSDANVRHAIGSGNLSAGVPEQPARFDTKERCDLFGSKKFSGQFRVLLDQNFELQRNRHRKKAFRFELAMFIFHLALFNCKYRPLCA